MDKFGVTKAIYIIIWLPDFGFALEGVFWGWCANNYKRLH
jgi:hypothetical protein